MNGNIRVVGAVIVGGELFAITRDQAERQIVVREDGSRVDKREMFAETIAFINQGRAALNAVT
jgi:hypothetical protein